MRRFSEVEQGTNDPYGAVAMCTGWLVFSQITRAMKSWPASTNWQSFVPYGLGVTIEGIDALKANLPNCTFHWLERNPNGPFSGWR